MKRIIPFVIVSILVIPNLALASWWNPVSWFNNWSFSGRTETKTEVLEKRIQELESKLTTPTTTPQLTKFYVKYDNARIRSCASIDGCNVVGYYNRTSIVTIKGEMILKLNDLPEWVSITTADGITGFISRSVLSETPVTKTTDSLPIASTETNKPPIGSGDNAVLTTIDVQIIATDKESIEYLKSEILDVNKSINFFSKFKQILVDMNDSAPKSVVIGDRYSKLVDILISNLEEDIRYFNTVVSQYTNMIDTLNKHISVAQENRKLFESKVYENDRAELTDAKFFFDQSQKDRDIIFKAYDISNDYSTYYQQQYSFYKKALSDFQNLLASDRTSLSQVFIPPTYTPSIPPTIPMIQMPKISRCNISPIGGGGVDLVVSCY